MMNVASYKLARQTDRYKPLQSNFVDQNTASCGAAVSTDTWRLEYAQEYYFPIIRITGGSDTAVRLLFIGNSAVSNSDLYQKCTSNVKIGTDVTEFKCGMRGNVLMISLSGSSVCEIEVFTQADENYSFVNKVNIITPSKVYMSSNPYGFGNNGDGVLAIDGNTDGNWASSTCVETSEESNPFWRAELPGSTQITRVKTFARTDAFPERFQNY